MYQDNRTVSCSKFVFDTTYRSSSLAIEWNLVCQQRWKGALAQAMYMFGVFAGAVVLGSMADKYGRKAIFCLSGILQLVFGVIVAFLPEYYTFLVITFLYGIFGSAGSYITGFVLTMELVGDRRRTACGISFAAAFAIGIVLVAAWGALINNRQVLQVVYGLHSLFLIPHIWIMDESPRWLWAQGHLQKSVDIVEKALKCNRSDKSLDKADLISKGMAESSKAKATPSATTGDLFKTPNLRNNTLNLCVCWFANSLVYYGLTLSTGFFRGNPYIITGAMGLIELPSYAAVIFFLHIIGRRALISSLILGGGLACIIAVFLPEGSMSAIGIVIIGKLFIAGSFAIIYNYTAEMIPTVVRNSAIGLGAMCARLSGALSPMITLLDSLDPKIPAITFGIVALISGILCLFLPETMNQPLPQTLAEGESFGKGDTCFTSCLGKRRKRNITATDVKPLAI